MSKIKWTEISAESESISTSTEKIEHILSIHVIFLIMQLAVVQLLELLSYLKLVCVGIFTLYYFSKSNIRFLRTQVSEGVKVQNLSGREKFIP